MARNAVAIPERAVPAGVAVGQSYWQIAWRRFKHHRVALLGGAVILLFLLLAIFAPYLTPYSFEQIDLLNRKAPPSLKHLLGTDDLGHDVLTRLLYAGRISLTVGFSAALTSAFFGTLIGGLAGFYGRWLDNVLMRITDIMLSIPDLPVIIILARYMGGSVVGIVFVLTLFAWMGTARLVRGEILKLRNQDFTEAARAMGASDVRILVRHLIPNALAPVIVAATLTVGSAILLEAALSFLGVGIQPPTPSWGNMLQNAQDFIWTAPWLAVWPGAMIFLTVLCFNFLGDGLRDALDPRLKV
ncbi:MAG: ABC transporter permease [Armatimonadota bacterium]|nr:ABC transporter permease [Armatimonadota bacterium]MDR5702224.1 ABC transporter permease [Armatimonadota bacterium]MDR7435234.1 ABC transporter permease [Armatimonadota bacterium]